jgi:hypothetical protein
MTRVAEPYRVDFYDAVGKLRNGNWVVYPYEAYGQLDRDEWNAELVKELARRGIDADVIDLPEKDLAVVVNLDAIPTFEQIVESVAAMQYHRFTGRPIPDERTVMSGRP